MHKISRKADSNYKMISNLARQHCIDYAYWSAPMRHAFIIARRALRGTDFWNVAAPPRLVSFVASLIGGLLVSTT